MSKIVNSRFFKMAAAQNTSIQPFDPYSNPENLGPRWTRWKESFKYFADTKWLIVEGADDVVQRSTQRRSALLHYAGPAVQEIFSTLPARGNDNEFDAAVAALDTYFVPAVNIPYARQKFALVTQKEGEIVAQFSTRLRHASRDCGYGADRDNQIRDAILARVKSQYIRRRLLEAGEQNLANTLVSAAGAERVLEMEAGMAGVNLSEKREKVRAVHHGKHRKFQKKTESRPPPRGKSSHGQQNGGCFRCGSHEHLKADPSCPAKNETCKKCGWIGHYAKCCRTRRNKYKTGVNNVTEENINPRADYPFSISEDGEESIGNVEYDDGISVLVGGVKIDGAIIDSGAKGCYMSDKTWEFLKKSEVKCKSVRKLDPGDRPAYAYMTREPLDVIGTFEAEVDCPVTGEVVMTEFIVIKGKDKTLLGKKTCTDLNILRVGPPKTDVYKVTGSFKVEEKFQDVMTGVGKLKDYQLKLHVDPKVKPVPQPVRRLPFGLRPKVEAKLKELLMMDIIEEVKKGTPTTWVSPLVVVPKQDGDTRMCTDMRRANEAIIRERHYIPTVEEVMYDMNGSTVFSKLDMRSGFHQIELDVDSREITMFITHQGLYVYKRLMFGLASAPEMYQKIIRDVLIGISKACNIADDIVVHGKDTEEHDDMLEKTLTQFRECGLTLNGKKCVFRTHK